MEIHNGLDLLELCMATDASSFLADTIVIDEDGEYSDYTTGASSGSDSEY